MVFLEDHTSLFLILKYLLYIYSLITFYLNSFHSLYFEPIKTHSNITKQCDSLNICSCIVCLWTDACVWPCMCYRVSLEENFFKLIFLNVFTFHPSLLSKEEILIISRTMWIQAIRLRCNCLYLVIHSSNPNYLNIFMALFLLYVRIHMGRDLILLIVIFYTW